MRSKSYLGTYIRTYLRTYVHTYILPFYQVHLTAIAASTGKEQSHSFSFQYKTDMGVTSLVSMVLSKKAKSAGTTYKEDSNDFILKVRTYVRIYEIIFHVCMS